MIASAPMVALAANSPFLFGRDLWDETRIPLFEQAVAVTTNHRSCLNRATYGAFFVQESLFELFQENVDNYPVLLPSLIDAPPEQLRHLRLQNGTVWRWNRPLIGFNDAGVPHLRVEHRTVPAGPSIVDTMANAAFYFGLVHALANEERPPETRITFQQARDNFYTACKEGLRAEIFWLDGEYVPVHELLWERLTSTAERGLRLLGIDETDVRKYTDVLDARLRTGQNGANWQRRFVEKHGADMAALAQAYRDNQQTGMPVHQWGV
jgi:gamma-glutamyl:cysteine ligase YbdK (ATP-grasp superfamily)